jgi:PEGA domain-containing protein
MKLAQFVMLKRSMLGLVFATQLFLALPVFPLEPVAAGAKVYINAMDGFGSFVTAAFHVKNVPLVVVADRGMADYEVVGSSDSQKAGWAKVIFLKQTGSREEASISVVDLRTSEYNTGNSYRGKQSAAESCAKHLAEAIRKGGRLASSLPPLTEQQAAALRARDAVGTSAADRTESQNKTEEPKAIVVRFTSTPSDAEVNIDGEYWGSTPTADLTRLPAGSHTIVVKKAGYQLWERKITLTPGENRIITAELEAQPADATKPRIVGAN